MGDAGQAVGGAELDYCRDKVAREGSDLYYCVLFASESVRAGLLSLFALQRELEEVVEDCSDGSIARRKLQYWHEELSAADPAGVSHPVSRALWRSGAMGHLDEASRVSLLHGTLQRITTPQILDDRQLQQLCTATAGGLMAAAARVCGATGASDAAARAVGSAVERSRLLRLPRRAGAPPHTGVPLDLLAPHPASPQEVDRGADSRGACAVREALLSRSLHALDEALALAPAAPGPVRGLGHLAHAHTRSLARSGFTAHARGRGITPLRKLWIAWRHRD